MLFRATLPMLALAAAQPAARAPIEGLWKNPTGSAIIAVAPCGSALCGKIVWASERGQSEVAKNAPHVVGIVVLTDVRPKGRGWAGKLYVPDDNIHVSARLQLLNENQLKLTGCGLGGLICRSQVWTRVQEPLPATD
jgi:uncharacterized protein (DUF2147 family)